MSEGKERNKRCEECTNCFTVITTNGIRFRGCFHEPYRGKWVSEIEKCPKEQEHE